MFTVSVGDPRGGLEVVVKKFETHEAALEFAAQLDQALGVPEMDETNSEGVCSLIDEY